MRFKVIGWVLNGMETRKVQRLGPSTLAMTLPAKWAKEHSVEKGDEVTIRTSGKGTLTVLPESASTEDSKATIRAGSLNAEALERAIVAQYVLGRRVIHIEKGEGALDLDHINAVYKAETQLMGLGVIEETPGRVAIRYSVDAEDFTLNSLLECPENTGSTMRNEAVKTLAHGSPDLAQRAFNRERQANKIFVLLLQLVFTSYQNPNLARAVGLDSGFPLIGYRSVAKNLELTAGNAEDIANIVIDAGGHTIDVDQSTIRHIREFTDHVDETTTTAVRAVIEHDYDPTIECRELFREISDRERDTLNNLPGIENQKLLRIREVLVSLQQTAQYAMRNTEIASNLALNEESDHVMID